MVFSIIKKSQLEGANRLDAEYYQPEYLEKIKKLQSSTVRLGDIAYITDGEHGSPIFDEKSGIKYFSAQHVRDGFIDDTNVNTISKIIDERNKRSQLKEGDVLLSTVGTIGFAGLVTKEFLPANIDRHVARIVLKEKTLEPEFLVAFLNSRYGKFQSVRESTGNVQFNLFIDKIKDLKVPKSNNPYIARLLKDALKELDNTENFYSQAENLLLEELGLKDFEVEDDLSFVVNLSEVKSAHRADAEYFQPKYEKLIEKIKNKNAKLLGELVSIKKGIEPGSEEYQEEGKLFFRVSSLSKFGFEDKDQKYLTEDLYQKLKDDFEPKVGEILLTKDATPGIAYALKEPIEGITAGGILRLKLKAKIEQEYLALAINSIVGQIQVERDTGGSVIVHWRPDQVRDCLIPVLSKSTQQKIANLVKKSHQARKKLKELLEKAKRKVEEIIEKGGEKTA
ncbi:MAG TPA: restriction endonuclease subunit S [Patescibacteria group bacterium]|nr:restriction endonuclease subunit S [Patescibacteria group bacterium]